MQSTHNTSFSWIRSDVSLSYASYVEEALYHPVLGYYAKKRKRIGREINTDFYTAAGLGAVFEELIVASCKNILGDSLEHYTFVEVGAEAQTALFKNQLSPFAQVQTISLGKDYQSSDYPCILFANELLDAQPFHRLIFKDNTWQELGVRCIEGVLKEVMMPHMDSELSPYLHLLPKEHIEGYCLDVSPKADRLLQVLLEKMRPILVIMFDYGYSLEHLLYNTPQGTARSYSKHQVTKNILDNPGQQDITHHVCWDFLIAVLKRSGTFSEVRLCSQESFFVQNGLSVIERIINEKKAFSKELQTLKELICPQHMGASFQVLFAK